MRECVERRIKVGFTRNPKKICEEIEAVTAAMIRDGWYLQNSCIEDGLGYAHLFFERVPEPEQER